MEDLSLNIPIIKAVKKVTYSGIIKKARLNLNPENAPVQGYTRSQSFKNITRFVPRIMPRKSTFVPTPLKLNKKKEDEDEKQLSEDEVRIIDSDSSDSIASSDLNNSSDEEGKYQKGKKKNINKNKIKNLEKENDKEKEDDKEIKKENDNLCINLEKIELNKIENDADSLNLNDNEEHKNLRAVRRKMSQIKARAGKIKSNEMKDIISDNFKNAFDIDLKTDDQPELYLTPKMHASVNCFGENNKPKTKSIFDVLSNSKKKNDNDN